MKKLSIVTTTYKSEKYLRAYFENVTRLEGFSEFEIVLILNDPNALETAIVEEYRTRFPENIRVITVPRESIAASTNRGFTHLDSEFLALADVDDIRAADCFTREIATLRAYPDADYTYGDFVIVSEQGSHKGLQIKVKDFTKDLATRASIVGPNHFFRTSLLKKVGLWDEQFRSGSDFDFQVRAAFNCEFRKTPGDALLYYTRYENSNSASSGKLQQIERTVVQLRYGIYDKINYSLLPQALQYDIYHVYWNGQKKHVREFVPEYETMLQQRFANYFRSGLRRNMFNVEKLEKLSAGLRYLVTDPVWVFKKVIRRMKK